MKQFFISLVCLFAFGSTAAVGQQPDEEVKVRLMLIDALVTDKAGKPVRGLTKDDFQMRVKNTIKPIDTFDEICAAEREKIPGPAPRIVLAFDYYGLTQPDRKRVVEAAAELLRLQKKHDEQVMIASMTNALRVEQRFTDDLELLLDTLERMEYDNTLATQHFGYLSGKQYFENMATLLDVLAAYDGSKAVVLYSATVTAPGANDKLYRDLTTRGRPELSEPRRPSTPFTFPVTSTKTSSPESGDARPVVKFAASPHCRLARGFEAGSWL